MSNFFRKLERFVVNVIIIALIFLISFQFLMKNDTAYQRIKDLELAVREFVGLDNDTVEVTRVTQVVEKNRGIIIIDLLQDLSLPQVWLVKNGERVESFARGVVRLAVEEGDLLTIDARFYPHPLWFEITDISPSISTWQADQQFRTDEEILRLGLVQFYDKL